uniref:Nucleoside diphosphate kinase n=1 Tax=Hirondellea gigas TaxID=1518452 RepID=A0A2P2I000_9CRUS
MPLKLLVLGSLSVAGLSVIFHLYSPLLFEMFDDLPQTSSPKSTGVSPKIVEKLKFVVVGCEVAFNHKDIMKEAAPRINGVGVPYYRLTYYVLDDTIEMIFSKNGKTWLNRSAVEAVRRSDLFIGNSVIINKKCVTVTAYSNAGTLQAVEAGRQSTFAMIKPDAMSQLGSVLSELTEQRLKLRIAGLRLLQLTTAQARHLYNEHQERPFFKSLVAYITSGPVLALHLTGPGAVGRWREALGPTDSAVARTSAPNSIRAKFGTDKQINAAHGSDSVAAAHRELSLMFPEWDVSDRLPSLGSDAEMVDALSCLVLPHVIKSGQLGALLTSLREQHNSEPGKAEMVRLNLLDAARYATGQLLPQEKSSELQETINELVSGPSLFIRLKSLAPDEAATDFAIRFKNIIGPTNPVKARQSAVESIRAMFGINEYRNALLCPLYDWNKN